MAADPPTWDKLHRLRSRLRRLMWWSGISRCLIALFGGMLVAGWCDWWLRFDDFGVRLLVAAGVWGIVGSTLWQTLWQPLRRGISDVFLAEQIDRHFPGLGNRITSAAEFRAAGLDPRQGSTELQQLVVEQAAADLRQVEPEQIVDPRRLTPLIGTALGTCLLTALVLMAFPLEAATAMRRLAWPWQVTPWPRSVVLNLTRANGQPLEWNPRDGLRIVRGDKLELRVENQRGPLPYDLALEIRQPGQQIAERFPIKIPPQRNPSGGASADSAPVDIVADRDEFEFRVTGGDDNFLPWHGVTAVDAPRLKQVRVTVVPPAYAQQPAYAITEGSTQIRGLVGSRVEVAGTADRPVASLELRVSDKPAERLTTSPDGLQWTTEVTIDRTSLVHFSFVLRDAEGFADPHPLQFELRGDADAIPEISLETPPADQWVTPTAVVPLAAEARDDLGLAAIRRVWQLNEDDPQTEQLETLSHLPLQHRYERGWALESLQLKAGDRIIFRLEAADANDLGSPRWGRSSGRTLLVVSPDEKRRELIDRIAEIVDDLQEASGQQRRLQEQAAKLQIQLRDVGALRPEDRDLLNRLQWDQRRLTAQIGDDARGLGQRARQLRSEFVSNEVSDPEAEPQLEQLAQELVDLARSLLPDIDQELTQAIKGLDADASRSNSADPADATAPESSPLNLLQKAETGQRRVIATLDERQAELSRWQSDRHLGDGLQEVANEQQMLNRDAGEVGSQTLSRALSELTPQQRADLNTLADRQRRLAHRAEQLEREFDTLSEQLEDRDPLRAAEARDVADQLRESQLAMRLRQASEDVAFNRLGNAGPIQQAAEAALRSLVEQWTTSRPDDVEQMLKRVDAAEQMAKSLHDDIEEMRKKSAATELANASDEARRQLREDALELRKRAERLERELQRLRLQRGQAAARQATESLRAGAEALAGDPGDAAAQEFAAAEQDIEKLQSELERERHRLNDQLAQEEALQRLETLKSLKLRQEAVVGEILRLENERQTSGRLTRGQIRSLQDLAAAERDLQHMAAKIGDELQQAVVAKSALASVARSLELAADRLGERQTDVPTQLLAGDAARRLSRIVEAWSRQAEQNEQAAGEAAEPPADGDQPEAAGPPPGEDVPLKLQLTLLRELQADCLERTVRLEQLRGPTGDFPAELLPLVTDLAAEQGQLIDLATQLAEMYRQQQQQSP